MEQTPAQDDEAAVFAALAADLAPVPLADDARSRIRARVLGIAPPPPAGTSTYRVGDAEGWTAPSEYIRMKVLRVDKAAGEQEILMRFLPGVQIPAHLHRKQEEMIVLEGEFQVGDHPLRAGDVHVAPPGSWHPVITSARGAVVLFRCEYPFSAG